MSEAQKMPLAFPTRCHGCNIRETCKGRRWFSVTPSSYGGHLFGSCDARDDAVGVLEDGIGDILRARHDEVTVRVAQMSDTEVRELLREDGEGHTCPRTELGCGFCLEINARAKEAGDAE